MFFLYFHHASQLHRKTGNHYKIEQLINNGTSIRKAATLKGISFSTLRRYCVKMLEVGSIENMPSLPNY